MNGLSDSERRLQADLAGARVLRALDDEGRRDAGRTIEGVGRSQARRRGVDPDSGLTFDALAERQAQLKADCMARTAARGAA